MLRTFIVALQRLLCFARLITQFLGRIVALDGFRHNRASRVTALVVGRLGRYDAGDVAAREACEDANE